MTTEPWRGIDAYLKAKGVRFGAPTLEQTTGGAHAKGSYHYKGLARDYGRSSSDLPKILAELVPFATGPHYKLAELYGLKTFWKNGRVILPSVSLRVSHQNHVHVALRPGAVLPAPAPIVFDPPAKPEVPPMFNPPIGIDGKVVAVLKAPAGGVWMLTDEGAIYAWECPDWDAPNRHPEYWADRKAARLEPFNGGYRVVDSTGATYEYPAR